jgi:hypothetical protein
VVIALVLASSLGMVMAVPVAANVSAATVTPLPNTAAAPAQYTIVFTTLEDLAKSADDDVRIEFPANTVVPVAYTPNSISINGTDVSGTTPVDVDIVGRMLTIDVPKDIPHGTVTVVFKSPDAGIVNPSTPGFYTLDVSTSREVTWVESAQYEITAGPVALYLKSQEPIEETGEIFDEFVASYDSIQDALDAADHLFWVHGAWKLYTECPTAGGYVGARIKVYPGTYDPIVIDTPGVEVVSTGGAGVTFIDGTVEPENGPAAVFISAGGVTFNGFTVKNAGVGIDADSWMDFDNDGIADIKGIHVVMLSNKNSAPIYDANGSPTSYTAYDARVNILNNVVYGGTSMGIAVFNTDGGACVLVSGNNVHDNQWDGFWASKLRQGVDIVDPVGPITGGLTACSEITNNTFADNGQGWNELDGYDMASSDNGIQIMSASGPPKTLYIVGNDISGNSNAGIYLGDDINDMVVIKFNQIENNDVFGISSHLSPYPLYSIVCIYNDIAGNGVWGIKNWEGLDEAYPPDFDDILVATLNYWGDLSGPSCGPLPKAHEPSQQSLALGQGDAVSHWVEYKWWLTSSFKDVREDLIRYYGSDCYGEDFGFQDEPIVPLEQGWNTMSTPVPLDERADQMGEICALGGWMQNYLGGYSYDPASGWTLLTGSYQLLPLRAVYVKMAGSDMLPILLRTTNYMPARNLAVGWNLVSLNAPFWTEGISDMPVDEALSSIEGSWGNAISPAMPGQEESWVCTPSTASGYDMYIGDGYWVFITKATTLAGFRMAPWYLDDWEMGILNCELPPWMQPRP